jgi:hypothetical protein
MSLAHVVWIIFHLITSSRRLNSDRPVCVLSLQLFSKISMKHTDCKEKHFYGAIMQYRVVMWKLNEQMALQEQFLLLVEDTFVVVAHGNGVRLCLWTTATNGQRWSDIDGRKPKNSVKNLFQFHFVHYKSHIGLPSVNPGFRVENPATNHLSSITDIVTVCVLWALDQVGHMSGSYCALAWR